MMMIILISFFIKSVNGYLTISRYRCYNGELYAQGEKIPISTSRVHPGDTVTLTLHARLGTLALKINNKDYGVIFTNLPLSLHFCVLFYNSQPPQRSVRLLSCTRIDDHSSSTASLSTSSVCSSISTSRSTEDGLVPIEKIRQFIHHLIK